MATDHATFPCRVVRHRGARRMTLRVSRAGARLTVPPRTSARAIEAFLRDSSGWLAEQRERLGPPPAPLAEGDRLALLDDELELALAPARRRTTVRRDGRRLVARLGPGAGLDAAVERWYRREAAAVLGARSRALAARLGVEVSAVTVRDPLSRWGSCSPSGRLSFSWRLLLGARRRARRRRRPRGLPPRQAGPLPGLLGAHGDGSRPGTAPRAPGCASTASGSTWGRPGEAWCREHGGRVLRYASRRVRRRASTARADSAPAIAAIPNARRSVMLA